MYVVSWYLLFTYLLTARAALKEIRSGQDDTVYQIDNCDQEQMDHLVKVLDLARGAVLPAIEELKSPIRSGPFEALLGPKTRYAEPALKILNNIQKFKGIRNRHPYPLLKKPPLFICAKPTANEANKELGLDPYGTCMQHRPWMWSFTFARFRKIHLCPDFWKQEVGPEPRRSPGAACPTIWPNNTWNDPKDIISYQKYVLVHELQHLYTKGNGLGWNTIPKEVYELNELMHLGGVSRLENPNNLEIFVAMTQLGCMTAVDPYAEPWNRPKPIADVEPLNTIGLIESDEANDLRLYHDLNSTAALNISDYGTPPSGLDAQGALSLSFGESNLAAGSRLLNPWLVVNSTDTW